MSQNKTRPSDKDVVTFLRSVSPKEKQEDCFSILNIMQQITGKGAVLWGDSIVGFGDYRYKTKSGRENNWFITGFSPRKNALTLYLFCDLQHNEFSFQNLGKQKLGKGCLYIKILSDVDITVLKNIIKKAVVLTQ